MTDHSMMKLGKLPAKVDPLVPRLAAFMVPAAPPPPSADWSHGLRDWGVMRNDELGDCTACGVAHFLQAMSAAAYTEFTARDEQVVAFYSATTGYNPADPSTDQGGVEVDVLRYLLKNGFCNHHVIGFGSLQPRDTDSVKRTIADLGGAYIGVALPISAQKESVWGEGWDGLSDQSPGSWGGHCVYACGYDATHVTFVSWGKIMKMTWNFWQNYVDEAYGLLWASMIKAGKAPNGLNLDALVAEVQKLKAVA